jgi:glycosyltransferase involved in cell wall biosynthesis
VLARSGPALQLPPMSSPLHIVAHNGAPEWGGAEIALSRLLLGLKERGHRVDFLVAKAVVEEGARAMGLEPGRLHVGGDVALAHTVRVKRRLEEISPDVLIVGTFRKTLHLALGARWAGVPVVSRIGMSSDRPRNLKYRLLFRSFVDHVAVNTGEIRADYLRELPGFDPARVTVVGKGLDLPELPAEPAEARRATRGELGIPEDAFVVGALARLVEAKRLDRWLGALATLDDGAWGLIVGEGPLRGELEARARALGVSSRVVFAGYRPEPGPWLRAMDLLLITSEQEALANAMLEAMSHGVAVATTPVNGSGDALLGEEDGVPPGVILGDFESATAHKAIEAIRAGGRAREMGRAARARIARHFSRDAELDGWERVLRAAVSTHAARG